MELQRKRHASVYRRAQAVQDNALFATVEKLSRALQEGLVGAVAANVNVVARGLQARGCAFSNACGAWVLGARVEGVCVCVRGVCA